VSPHFHYIGGYCTCTTTLLRALDFSLVHLEISSHRFSICIASIEKIVNSHASTKINETG